MEKIIIVGCGEYMDATYGCPGEWRCLKAANLGEGFIKTQSQVTGFIRCECPGRTLISTIKMQIKLSGIAPDKIYLATCLAHSKPGCPYTATTKRVKMLETALDIEVISGTHDYH